MTVRKRNAPEGTAGKSRREPRSDGTLWLYGIHPVTAALANPARRARRLVATAEATRALAAPLPAGLQPEVVERQRIDQLLPAGSVHQGLALLCDPLPPPDLEEACTPRPGRRNLVLVLDQVSDPHNVGAILRSAGAFGARAVVVTDRHAPPASAALAKAASGALESVPLVRVTNLARALDQLAALGYWRIGLDGGAERTLAGLAPEGDVALVLGGEGSGLRRLTAERCDLMARLPISRAVESLNVSNAAAVALYELVRGDAEPAVDKGGSGR